MTNSMSCSHGRWCTRADALLGAEGVHISSVTASRAGLVLGVSMTFPVSAGRCAAVGQTRLAMPGPGLPTELTFRAAAWAADALQRFDTSVSALAHQLGVSWHTLWDAVRVEATRRIAATNRLDGVDALRVDEHVWSRTGPPGSGMVTGIVDHTRDARGVVHAKLLDLIPGRSGKAYGDWLKIRGPEFTAGIKTAALDPFRGYANAIRDELPEAITVLDAFHVVKPGSAMVDEVRRRVQQDTLGHRGRKGGPLYGIRRTLQIDAEHLTEKQAARSDAKLAVGDPDHEVTLAWQCYQKLRHI